MKLRLLILADGFTMVELLLSFSITLMLVSLLPVFGSLASINHDFMIDTNLEVGLAQLGNDLVTARKIQSGSTLIYQDHTGQENRIRLDGDRLIRTPGYVVYCSKIENVQFSKSNRLLYLSLQTRGKKGIYLIGSDYEP